MTDDRWAEEEAVAAETERDIRRIETGEMGIEELTACAVAWGKGMLQMRQLMLEHEAQLDRIEEIIGEKATLQ
jgi:hypothetical protein